MNLSFDELVERMTKAMQEMTGTELANLYNKEFGNGMVYRGNEEFTQFDTMRSESLTWLDLRRLLAESPSQNEQVAISTNGLDEDQFYFGFQLAELPDDCDGILDEGHQAIHFRADTNALPAYSWESLVADIDKMTPERQLDDVTVFAADIEEVYQVKRLETSEVNLFLFFGEGE